MLPADDDSSTLARFRCCRFLAIQQFRDRFDLRCEIFDRKRRQRRPSSVLSPKCLTGNIGHDVGKSGAGDVGPQ